MSKWISSIEYIYFKLLITYKIRDLLIEAAGIDRSGTHYVKIRDGFIFYGPESRQKDYKYYRLLPGRIKHQLPFSCYSIATDIIIRYSMGGLKLGGPKKERYYHVKPGDIVSEMGAYRGYFCLYLSQKVGSAGKVIAIEPLESNLYFLRKNVEENKITNVSIVSKGVWKEKSRLLFKKGKRDYQSSSINLNHINADEFQVDVDSLDTIYSELGVKTIDLIIIQLNGSELEALEGLNHYRPENMAIAARYNSGGFRAARQIKDHLKRKDYLITICNRDYIFAEKIYIH